LTMGRRCADCSSETLSSWKFCPECGAGLETESVMTIPDKLREEKKHQAVPDRFAILIEDYSALTGHPLDSTLVSEFISNAQAKTLSVIDRERRVKAGKVVRRNLGGQKYSLDLTAWLDAVYDLPSDTSVTRVWITTRGERYHLSRDCKALRDGQNYARFFGKDTYNPQFIPIRTAAFVLALIPCAVCKPPHYQNPSEKKT